MPSGLLLDGGCCCEACSCFGTIRRLAPAAGGLVYPGIGPEMGLINNTCNE